MPMAFQFKQFSIEQDKCAMKIGTDGVLLGSWTSIEHNPHSVLDIGAGTGVLALMLAQRSFAQQIDALEIDANAYEQCVNNFENSPWRDRLFCYHAAFDEFVTEMQDEESYDLILSNPPFYTSSFKTLNSTRDLARFEDALPFKELLTGVTKLLADNGIFSVIIPFSAETNFITLARKANLYPQKITRVKGNINSETKRTLIAFTKTNKQHIINELCIEIERNVYTEDYIALTKDFYLNF